MLSPNSTINQSPPRVWGADTPIDELIRRLSTGGGSTARSEFAISRQEVDNSTARQADSGFLNREASFLLEAASDTGAGDDPETQFYEQLQAFIARYQKQAVDALNTSIMSQQNKSFGVSKLLEAMGAIDDAVTVSERFWVLQRGLLSSSRMIRYGAALGFASLQDSRALPVLEHAVARELNEEVRSVVQQVITFLESSR